MLVGVADATALQQPVGMVETRSMGKALASMQLDQKPIHLVKPNAMQANSKVEQCYLAVLHTGQPGHHNTLAGCGTTWQVAC